MNVSLLCSVSRQLCTPQSEDCDVHALTRFLPTCSSALTLSVLATRHRDRPVSTASSWQRSPPGHMPLSLQSQHALPHVTLACSEVLEDRILAQMKSRVVHRFLFAPPDVRAACENKRRPQHGFWHSTYTKEHHSSVVSCSPFCSAGAKTRAFHRP